MGTSRRNQCWATLITSASYLPGVIVLAHTLDLQESLYPLVVLYTTSLGSRGIEALQVEAQRSGRIKIHEVDLLVPRGGLKPAAMAAARFTDTFTKLRVFELYKLGYNRVCYLDADMAVFQNPDHVFVLNIPDNHLLATHCCVCNLDSDTWAPKDWHKGNCAYTSLLKSDDVASDTESRPTYSLLNGGLFLFDASQYLWKQILHTFDTSTRLSEYQFPDQDFLADFYHGSWVPISWRYNAIKTMRYWHPRLWRDDDVVIVHYIVDKPWERKIRASGLAGHLGRDGETHQWWWNQYDSWEKVSNHPTELSALMKELLDQKPPIEEAIPLPQSPGLLEDVTEPLEIDSNIRQYS